MQTDRRDKRKESREPHQHRSKHEYSQSRYQRKRSRSRTVSMDRKNKKTEENYISQDYEYLEELKRSLPIYSKKMEIIEMIAKNNFTIITGETGSGKTTQLPQYILEAFPGSRIVVTQPRRVAAIQIAKRVAYETKTKLGGHVGYTIRFNDNTSENTKIKFVTDGILVRECFNNKYLSQYDFIIIDEAHERSLYTDILFALCKDAVMKSDKKLKLIITSATLNKSVFSSYFNNCPVLPIEGKCFPVEISHHPCRSEKRVETSVQLAIRIHLHENPGHILVFLTGYEECEQACKLTYLKLQELKSAGKIIGPLQIMPLYGSQDTEDQTKVFEKSNNRKLIYSTNIAETSLTVDGIGYVIDCGYVKQKTFNAQTGMDSLSLVSISKVQATQRLGRAGRTGPGKCIRLYSQDFYDTQMANITLPEILRVNLSTTLLTLKSLGINDVYDFDFMDKPPKEYIIQALKHLYFLKAVDEEGRITKFGLEISKFPLDCSYSRVLLCSKYFCIEDEILSLVSLISTENVWFSVNKYDEEKKSYFDEKKKRFIDDKSDQLLLLNIYKEWKFNGCSERWCREHFIHYKALRQAENIKHQLKEVLDRCNHGACIPFLNLSLFENLNSEIAKNPLLDDYDKINCYVRICLSQGFFMNAVKHLPNHGDDCYLRLSDGSLVYLDNNSSIYSDKKSETPNVLAYTELSGSMGKPTMKMVSIIEMKWIVDLVNLLKNLDTLKLITVEKEENSRFTCLTAEANKIDLYKLIEKPRISSEDQLKAENELKEKADKAKERYLMRKQNK